MTPRTLEGFVSDNWGAHSLTPEVMAVLEPYRDAIEGRLDGFEPDECSWRDYRPCVYEAIPESVAAEVDRLILSVSGQKGEAKE
jgi:hypothetical protein